jgi:hypothetical protein
LRNAELLGDNGLHEGPAIGFAVIGAFARDRVLTGLRGIFDDVPFVVSESAVVARDGTRLKTRTSGMNSAMGVKTPSSRNTRG